jgi:hypothetical protein
MWTFAILIVVSIALGAGLHHMRSICEEETVSELSNGTYVAVVFHRDCRSDETVHINLRKEGSRFGTDFLMGNINDGEVIAATSVTRPIEARWTGPKSLAISIPPDSILPSPYAPRNLPRRTLIAHMEKIWRDVTITYERQP